LIIRSIRLTRDSIGVAIASCLKDFSIVVFIVLRSDALLCLFDFDIGNGEDNGEDNNKDIHEGDKDVIYNVVEENK